MGVKSVDPQWPCPDYLATMDRRARRTRSALNAALVELLREKGIDGVTVRELTERADVNRSTFYAHYQDIYDMVSQAKVEMCERCRALVQAHAAEVENYDFRRLARDVLEYLDQNEEVFEVVFGAASGSALLGAGLTESLRDTCLEVMRPVERLGKVRLRKAQQAGLDVQKLCDYHFDSLFSGVLGMISCWLASGKRESIDFLIDLIDSYTDALDFNDVVDRLLHRTAERVPA